MQRERVRTLTSAMRKVKKERTKWSMNQMKRKAQKDERKLFVAQLSTDKMERDLGRANSRIRQLTECPLCKFDGPDYEATWVLDPCGHFFCGQD